MGNPELGKRIEMRRKQLNLTLDDIASEIGVAKSTIQRYEKGVIDKIKLPVVEAIARVLDVDPAWICCKTDEMRIMNASTAREDTQMPICLGGRIRDARKAAGLTQQQLAEKVKVSNTSISNWEKGVSNPDPDAIQHLCWALEVEPNYFFWDDAKEPNFPFNILPIPQFVKKPRLGVIACGKPILAVEDAEEFDMVPSNIKCDFTLCCKGDSMITARIFDGDIVYIRSQPEVENGEIAAVRIGDEATLKKVYFTPGSDRITLRACNPMYPDMEYQGDTLNDIEILGKAVAFTSVIL